MFCVGDFVLKIGTSKRRTRGKTLCTKIHARTIEEREEVTFNEDGQPIGPSNKVVSDLSLFLGTLARNSALCPLRYTNWTEMPEKNLMLAWKYTTVCVSDPLIYMPNHVYMMYLICWPCFSFCRKSLSCRMKQKIGLRRLLEMHGDDINAKLRKSIIQSILTCLRDSKTVLQRFPNLNLESFVNIGVWKLYK